MSGGGGYSARRAAASSRSASPGGESAALPGQKSVDVSASVARNGLAAEKGVVSLAAAGRLGAASASAGSKVLGVLGKAALPLTIAAGVGSGLYQGAKRYQQDGMAGAAEGAFWGAMESVTLGAANALAGRNADGTSNPARRIDAIKVAVGYAPSAVGDVAHALHSWATAQGSPAKHTAPAGRSAVAQAGNPGSAAKGPVKTAFNKADTKFQRVAQAAQPKPDGPGAGGLKGFQIPKVQASAQRAKGNNYEGPEE